MMHLPCVSSRAAAQPGSAIAAASATASEAASARSTAPGRHQRPRSADTKPSGVTLLHGFGGVGKSLLAQQIGTAAVFQRELLNGTVDACPVLGWFGEDDHDELWRRQEAICAAFGVEIVELDGKVFWRPCPGDDITMFKGASEGEYVTTPALKTLREQISELGAKLVVLDSATQIAAISEISRPLVTRCLQALTQICIELDTTILLLGHNNRNGDFSGSSAWENRVRSRLHLQRVKDEDASGERTVLCRPKANYAAREEGVQLEWCDGAFRCVDHRFESFSESLDRKMRERLAERVFLDALDEMTKQRRAMSDKSKAGASYAPRMIVANGLNAGPEPRGNLDEALEKHPPFTERELQDAMNRLFRDGRIIADAELWRKGNRHFATGIARKRECATVPELTEAPLK